MSRTVTVAGFALLAAAMSACQLLGLTRTSATLGQAVAWLLGTGYGRPLLWVAWLWLGWHLFVRGAYS